MQVLFMLEFRLEVPMIVTPTLWYMKKEAYADTTIKAVNKRLKHLANYCNLDEPENVKGFVTISPPARGACIETNPSSLDVYLRIRDAGPRE